ncbi:S8 family serine peptidase [Mucilaginibacter pineti]|uniref:S8 family serine peptidase n=1 Tax=Mucilaginibacter pineti TaxID=1391627 RepID=UPI0013BE8E7B|nr:S8 family serine peptidase [Mucilaginibacter pineti]
MACIKPDVVEYGGDFLRKIDGFLITQHNETSTAVVKTGAGRTGFLVGTSFAAPKVAHIVAQLAKKFSNDSTLQCKALVIQSARLPEHLFFQPNTLALRILGYVAPDTQRALENTITLPFSRKAGLQRNKRIFTLWPFRQRSAALVRITIF